MVGKILERKNFKKRFKIWLNEHNGKPIKVMRLNITLNWQQDLKEPRKS
jgi:hypothetical protein